MVKAASQDRDGVPEVPPSGMEKMCRSRQYGAHSGRRCHSPSDTPEFLWTLQQTEDARIDHVTLETRSRKKVIQKKKHQNLQIHKLIRDRSGAAAYVLKPHGAKKLLDASKQACALADALISDNTNLSSWQAVPALAAQMDQFETDKKDHEVTKQSQIDQEPRPTNKSVRQHAQSLAKHGDQPVLRPGYLSVEVPFKRARFKYWSMITSVLNCFGNGVSH